MVRSPIWSKGLIVSPGDTLIVRVARDATLDQCKTLRESLRERLPELADVVVLNADEIAVFRPAAVTA